MFGKNNGRRAAAKSSVARSPNAPPGLWPEVGRVLSGQQGSVGYETPETFADVADARGRDNGGVRLDPRLATGDDAPSSKELNSLGGVREAGCEVAEAVESQSARERQATVAEREAGAAKRVVYRQSELEHHLSEVPKAEAELEEKTEAVATLRQEYEGMPLVARGLGVFNALWRVELIAGLAAVCDALALAKPLQNAGLADDTARLLLTGAVAAGIWVAINGTGLAAGLIAHSLPREGKRNAAFMAMGSTLLLLMISFLLVGLGRHEWIEQSNEAIRLLTDNQPAAPALLDPLFLTPIQMAAALGAVICIALFVVAQPGRDKRSEMALAEIERQDAEVTLSNTKALINSARRAVEEADVAINDVRADGQAAKVDETVVHEKWQGEREQERALTAAMIARNEAIYCMTDKLFANGNCWRVQLPDIATWLGRIRRAPRTMAASEDNSQYSTRDELARLINDK